MTLALTLGLASLAAATMICCLIGWLEARRFKPVNYEKLGLGFSAILAFLIFCIGIVSLGIYACCGGAK